MLGLLGSGLRATDGADTARAYRAARRRMTWPRTRRCLASLAPAFAPATAASRATPCGRRLDERFARTFLVGAG